MANSCQVPAKRTEITDTLGEAIALHTDWILSSRYLGPVAEWNLPSNLSNDDMDRIRVVDYPRRRHQRPQGQVLKLVQSVPLGLAPIAFPC